MRRALEVAVQLGEHLHVQLRQAQLPPATMQQEMQVGLAFICPYCILGWV